MEERMTQEEHSSASQQRYDAYYTSCLFINIIACITVVITAGITGSAWVIIGLLFISELHPKYPCPHCGDSLEKFDDEKDEHETATEVSNGVKKQRSKIHKKV